MRRREASQRPQRPPSKLWRASKALAWVGLWGALALVGVTAWLYVTADDALEFAPQKYVVTEITQLHKVRVSDVVQPRTTEEIAKVFRETTGAVSIGGARCSMGGQVAEPGSLHLDMRKFNQVLVLDKQNKRITVQAGITWRDIQDRIDPEDLAVKIMQTYSNFTVGGSLSVNAHGRYMGRGPLVQSVHSLKLVLPSGEIVQASPTENAELFYGVIGGYGGLAVIAEATLDLVPNGKVERTTQKMPTSDYAGFFKANVRDNKSIVFHNADLLPPDFEDARAVSWVESDAELTETERLIPRGQDYSWQSGFINSSASYPGGFALREYVVEPWYYSSPAVTYRNHEASYDVAELEPPDCADTTYVLREYFVPAERFDEFVPKMRDIFLQHEVAVINVSVRHASADPGTVLAWARGETFAFVVYYQQGTSPEAVEAVGEWSRELVDAVLSVGGTYYLPYQNHATREQFLRAYPRAPEFFALKQRFDPHLRLQNSLFYHYGPSPRAERDKELATLKYERKPEGQTLLTVPEWYLVWNPVEYVQHLEQGRPPDAFPFMESVREYLSLYKKVLSASDGVYPDNAEYVTMLRVIGASTAVEYLIKGAYESTVGRAFRWTSSGAPSQEEALILEAQRAYSQLIFEEPWYEFGFFPWVKRIWSETPVTGENFLRRTERKLAFSAEFTVKALYAEFLGWAAASAYGPSNERIHALVRAPEQATLPPGVEPLGVVSSAPTEPGTWQLLSLGRWNTFSKAVPQLAASGYDFIEIAGNDHIAVSLLEKRGPDFVSPLGRRLLRSRVVSDASHRRSVWFVPVAHLSEFLQDAASHGTEFEHIYDY